MAGHEADCGIEGVVEGFGVRVEGEEQVTLSAGEGGVVASSVTEVSWFFEQHRFGVLPLDPFDAAVGGGIVDDDHLVRSRRRVAANRGEAGAQEIGGVPVDDQHAQHRNSEGTRAGPI